VRTLHLYLTRQVVASLLVTMAVFTFVLLLGNLLKDVLTLLIGHHAPVGLVLKAILLLIPYVWAFALPMAMLTATLLVFGRFSADQELTAARAGGISLLSLSTPILLLSLLMCGACALVNMEIAPRCWSAYRNLMADVKANLAEIQLPEGRPIKDFDGYIVYVARNRNKELRDVIILQLEDKTNVTTTIQAPRGKYYVDTGGSNIVVELFDVSYIRRIDGRTQPGHFSSLPLSLESPAAAKARKRKIPAETLGQLLGELHDLEERISLPASPLDRSAQEDDAKWQDVERQITSPLRTQIHQMVSSSFACFGFTLLGIPLAIRMHRRETNVGFAVALVLVFSYYSLLLIGQGLSTRPEFVPHLIMWLPNFLFQSVGAVLLWRANRGI
jgi:lipopolysaccharide export system permease protein